MDERCLYRLIRVGDRTQHRPRLSLPWTKRSPLLAPSGLLSATALAQNRTKLMYFSEAPVGGVRR